MSIPVVFGWGKKGKEVGYIGIHKCPNCKNYDHFSLYEYSNRITLYWVPVAKFNKKVYAVCSTCDAAFELNEDGKKELLELSIRTLNRETTAQIWNATIKLFSENAKDYIEKHGDKSAIFLMQMCIKNISAIIPDEDYVTRVVEMVFQYLLDDDKTE